MSRDGRSEGYDRRYRAKRTLSGRCARCPEYAEEGHLCCRPCLDRQASIRRAIREVTPDVVKPRTFAQKLLMAARAQRYRDRRASHP